MVMVTRSGLIPIGTSYLSTGRAQSRPRVATLVRWSTLGCSAPWTRRPQRPDYPVGHHYPPRRPREAQRAIGCQSTKSLVTRT